MRKACIDLIGATNAACLMAGDLGTGRCLFMVVVAKDMFKQAPAEKWAEALDLCQQKAIELKYEVTRIRGGDLAGLSRA
ncbi:MAG: hypothetical protein PW844_27325 [Pantoea sp.]|uniref:hypothetical protein n=1 Tax=Pantoea sp. TaxID=69393 RepID=UPI00238DC1EF|nr:hypothetical protein [Pantoea sp.]MDE1190129.1 hypothetical protein [Pantoea sp.]